MTNSSPVPNPKQSLGDNTSEGVQLGFDALASSATESEKSQLVLNDRDEWKKLQSSMLDCQTPMEAMESDPALLQDQVDEMTDEQDRVEAQELGRRSPNQRETMQRDNSGDDQSNTELSSSQTTTIEGTSEGRSSLFSLTGLISLASLESEVASPREPVASPEEDGEEGPIRKVQSKGRHVSFPSTELEASANIAATAELRRRVSAPQLFKQLSSPQLFTWSRPIAEGTPGESDEESKSEAVEEANEEVQPSKLPAVKEACNEGAVIDVGSLHSVDMLSVEMLDEIVEESERSEQIPEEPRRPKFEASASISNLLKFAVSVPRIGDEIEEDDDEFDSGCKPMPDKRNTIGQRPSMLGLASKSLSRIPGEDLVITSSQPRRGEKATSSLGKNSKSRSSGVFSSLSENFASETVQPPKAPRRGRMARQTSLSSFSKQVDRRGSGMKRQHSLYNSLLPCRSYGKETVILEEPVEESNVQKEEPRKRGLGREGSIYGFGASLRDGALKRQGSLYNFASSFMSGMASEVTDKKQ